MTATIPLHISVLSLGANVVVCGLLLFGLFQGLAAADLPQARKTRFGLIASIGVIGWLFVAGELARAGVFEARIERVFPMIALGTGLPIVFGLLAIRFSATLRAVIAAVPMQRLIGVQLYRALGFIFLLAYGANLVPGAFAWPAGLGDMAVGLLAPLVAWRVLKSAEGARGTVLAWNLLGIGDLVLAVTLGFLSSPSRFQAIAFDAPNAAMSAYPLVMVPIFAVPVSILLHAAALSKLRAARRAGSGINAHAAA